MGKGRKAISRHQIIFKFHPVLFLTFQRRFLEMAEPMEAEINHPTTRMTMTTKTALSDR